MPTYEYECQHCKHKFEKFQNMTDTPLKRCPKCRHKIKRLLGTGGGIIFKGSGFYETDYRSEGYAKKAKEERAAATSTKTDAKTESKGQGSKGKDKTATAAKKGTDK
jgi:putative FmdB family regulatory protein